MAQTKGQMGVSERAVWQRISRKLAAKGRILRNRASRLQGDPRGDFYLVDLKRNFVLQEHVDLAEFAEELGVLKRYEKIAG